LSYINGFIQHFKEDQSVNWKKTILETLREKQHVHDLLDGKVSIPQLDVLDVLVEQEIAQLAKSSITPPEVLQVAVRDKDTAISKKILPGMFGVNT